VVVDLDVQRSPEQQDLVKKYYRGYIPHVLVLDVHGEPLYNQAGEVDSGIIKTSSRDLWAVSNETFKNLDRFSSELASLDPVRVLS
jgi:hypothetical protein